MATTIHMFVDERLTFLWTDDKTVQAWKFQSANRNRMTRYERIMRNAVRAYHEMLVGVYGVEDVTLVTNEAQVTFPHYDTNVVDYQTMFALNAKKNMPMAHIHTPFFSRDEMCWGEDASEVRENHVYVDASACTTGDVTIACYTVYANGQTDTHEIDAASSVDAEYQGIQKALHVARRQAQSTGQRVVVFADCTPAIIRSILLRGEGEHPYLGQTVFVQWLPGHRGHQGMTVVDRASREHLRGMM